jgi:hypothetical protein
MAAVALAIAEINNQLEIYQSTAELASRFGGSSDGISTSLGPASESPALSVAAVASTAAVAAANLVAAALVVVVVATAAAARKV